MWDVKENERLRKEYVEESRTKLQQQILLGQRILSLEGMVGYRDYVKTLRNMKEVANRALVGWTKDSDGMRILQGRVQALEDIVSLLENTKVRMTGLQDQLERLEKDWQSVTKGKTS